MLVDSLCNTARRTKKSITNVMHFKQFKSNVVHTYVQTFIYVIGASLSEPHTSKLSGTSIMFTKINREIRIHGMCVAC